MSPAGIQYAVEMVRRAIGRRQVRAVIHLFGAILTLLQTQIHPVPFARRQLQAAVEDKELRRR